MPQICADWMFDLRFREELGYHYPMQLMNNNVSAVETWHRDYVDENYIPSLFQFIRTCSRLYYNRT